MPAMTPEDTLDILGPAAADAGAGGDAAHEADYLARTVTALGDGRPAYVRAITDELVAMREHGGPGGGDAVSALVALMAPGGQLAKQCGFCYELRLHRARGYGAPEALQLHGPAAPRLGAPALPPVGTERRRPRSRSASLCAAARAATD